MLGLVVALAAPLCLQAQLPDSQVPGLANLNQYPGLLPEFGHLTDKLQHEVQFPPARSHSVLLPLLPASTMSYVALPNYGEAAQQALAIFHEELNQSAPLRQWWTHGDMAEIGPKLELSLDRLSRVSSYLGDEMVISGALDGREANVIVLAQVRKPGLKAVLQQTVLELARKPNPGIRVLDPQQLAALALGSSAKELLILVRPDFVVASTDLSSLRSFNAQLDRPDHSFIGTPFAQRILKSYQTGVTVMAAADVQKIISTMPPNADLATFQRTGFADLQYAVWEHKLVDGKTISQAELSFTGPRRGIASWIGAPVPLSSLDFVSPKALFALTLVLNNPARILDDLKQLSASNPNAVASFAQSDQLLGVSLKDDILSQLSGEVTIEVDSSTPPAPTWKAILRVKDANILQQTFGVMTATAQLRAEQYDENGVTCHVVHIPSPKGDNAIAYAFVDGYLVLASSDDALASAVHAHQGGDSLAKSRKFQAALPPGHSGASALFYHDPAAIMAMRLQQLSPDLAGTLSQFAGQSTPTVVAVYGTEDSISEASTSPAMDAGVVLMGAAIAIPNLLRSRIAANEAAAIGTLRSFNVAQVTYAATYPDQGFAPDLATLGPDPNARNAPSGTHAGLIDATLGNNTCTAGHWCENSGYRFTLKAACGFGTCNDFVALATPLSANTGTRSFCSTSDHVIRYQVAAPLTTPISLWQCKSWAPLK